jgi:hypothetical protein
LPGPHPVDFLLQRPPDNLGEGCVFRFSQPPGFGNHFGWNADPSEAAFHSAVAIVCTSPTCGNKKHLSCTSLASINSATPNGDGCPL